MEVKRIILASLVSVVCFGSYTNSGRANSETMTKDTFTNLKVADMKSYISMFEIPATNISRAINFYQTLLDIKIEKMDVEDMQMGILPYEGQMVTGVIIMADGYMPSADGVTMYLNAGENFQVVLDRVEKNGGKIIVPKTAHADESGYFAIFLDSEGNKMALNSPN
ncbi:VOC family protein [Zobellia sp. B3R18]|uniref:VOC family protein n=1 Tax=Zobellia sp. B3R18 TaxID=2841568 RepID=UPI001C0770E6|nr:VOC family protein [Zobellia sp. B3R18]MBU2975545.1 VOC family protein [Zobellia sp. B3R18]